MKIVHVEDMFFPTAGYQLNIISKFMVKQDHEVTIVTSEIDKNPDFLKSFFVNDDIAKLDNSFTNQTGVKIIRIPLNFFYSGRAVFKKNIYKIVNELNPDILYIHGNDTLTAIRFLLRTKKLNFPVISDSHMVDIASNNKFNKLFRLFYKTIITPIIKKYQIKIIRTANDDYVKRRLGIPLSLCPVMSFGSDTSLFYPNESRKNSFRGNYDIKKEEFVILYIGKLDESKGGLFLANSIQKKLTNTKNINVTFIIVGNSNNDDYGLKVEKTFDLSENRIIRFPTQNYYELPKFFQAADLCVFPKQCSLTFFDAQACGLPVVVENNNINSYRLKHNNGFMFEQNSIDDLRKKIIKCIEMPEDNFEEMKKNSFNLIKENYNYEKITNDYLKLIEKEINRFNSNKNA